MQRRTHDRAVQPVSGNAETEKQRALAHAVPGVLCAGMAAQFAVGCAVIPFITLLFADRGLGLNQISQIFTASSATLLIFPFFWGMLADRWMPLNRLFTILNLTAGAALALLVVQRSFPGLLMAFTCYFAAFNPTLYLMNALGFHHLSDPRTQFARLRAWGSLGWIVPFLPISLWLATHPRADLNFVLYLGIGCCVVMTTVSFWLPHTAPGGRTARVERSRFASAERLNYRRSLARLLTDPNYVVLLFSMFLMAGSFSLLTYYSPPRLQEAGVPRAWIGPVHAIGVLFEIVLFQWLPGWLRRWNYSTIILAGCALLAVRQLLFALISNAWVLAASYLLAGAVIVFYNQAVSILVNSLAAKEVRSTAQTLLLFFGQGSGPLFANAIVGRLASRSGEGLATTFLLGAALATLAATVVALRGRRLDAAGR